MWVFVLNTVRLTTIYYSDSVSLIYIILSRSLAVKENPQ